ncbi:MAG: hypothetical protein LBQ20_03230 [Rhodanobacter sp.]|jgi:hypothetical protein|nr:hypothetical protein [Rhodanobacter sp.]
MIRSSSLITAITAIALCVGCVHSPTVDNHGIPTNANKASETEVYRKFLDNWIESEKTESISVAMEAEEPSPKKIEQFSDCAREDNTTTPHWLPAKSISDLSDIVGKLPYVRLVDSNKWEPHDPGELISQGQSVESAVKDGFAGGLLTFSAITFDESYETAAFAYSFICGRLCGNGAIVIYRKTQSGWVQSKHCGDWIS